MGLRVAVLLFLACLVACSAGAQEAPATEAYTDKDAYEVYSVLLPGEEVYGFAKGTLIIVQETTFSAEQQCGSAHIPPDFESAFRDFENSRAKRFLLQRNIRSDKPYEFVSHDLVWSVLKAGSWHQFNELHPGSGGYIAFSAVGFNKTKDRAVVYSGSSCGGRCGSWGLHLLQKINGKWQDYPGSVCAYLY
jgi:hypothetical protein